ncbi:MAG TPA: HAD family phosphatase [Solirubrobacterales bacterium]|nr:HAD family phosphatase [Solirubrobacterales bacterium]
MTAVVFDLDGVLVDSEAINRLAFEDYLAGLGLTASDELFAITLGRRPADFGLELAAALGRPLGEVEIGLAAATAARMRSTPLRAMPFAAEAVRALAGAGLPLGLASCSGSGFIGLALAELGVERDFTAIASGEDVERGKPDPEIYRLAAGRLGVLPCTCIAIEDSAPGIAAAQAAGMTCIGVANDLAGAGDLRGADAVAGDLRVAAELVLAGRRRREPQGMPGAARRAPRP